jgi:hypothetical protein
MSTVLAPAQLLTHDVGVPATPQRRQFTLAYKKEILRAAERCTAPGEVAALLRREGLYSSHLATWRKAEREGRLGGSPAAAAAPRRGRKPDTPEVRAAKEVEAAAARRIVQLERELKRAKARAERAEALIEAQKKVASLLDHLLPQRDDDENSGNTGKR